jgi:hypothetical protein
MYTLERKKNIYIHINIYVIKKNYKSSLIPIQQYFMKLQKNIRIQTHLYDI